MARSAADIQTEIETLSKAIGSGVLRTRHGDTEKMYQSIEQMLKAKAVLEAELVTAGSSSPVKQVRFQTSKGF